jgi:hypothetical protein
VSFCAPLRLQEGLIFTIIEISLNLAEDDKAEYITWCIPKIQLMGLSLILEPPMVRKGLLHVGYALVGLPALTLLPIWLRKHLCNLPFVSSHSLG